MVETTNCKKVLFIDTWSKGTFFTNSVANLLISEYELFFLHADKIYSYDSPEILACDQYVFFDVDDFNNSILKAIDYIKPDIVVFISMHGLFHRWANRVCSLSGIKTIFFMHGVRGMPSKNAAKLNIFSLFSKFSRAILYTKQFFYMIMDIKKLEPLRFKLVKDWLELIFNNHRYTYSPSNKSYFNFDVVCLNDGSDVEFFSDKYGISPDVAIVTGNVSARSIALKSCENDLEATRVVFYSQPVVNAKMMEREAAFDLIIKVAEIVHKVTGDKMLLRLHPRDDFDAAVFSNIACLEVSENEAAVDIAITKVAIGYFSALLISAIDLGIPMVTIKNKNMPTIPCIDNYHQNTIITVESDMWETQLLEAVTTKYDAYLKKENNLVSTSKLIADQIRKLS